MAEAGPPPGDTASTAAPSAEEGAATAASAPPPPPGGAARPEKIRIQFKAVGSAPILKRNKFQIAATETFFAVDQFLRSQLKLHPPLDAMQRFCTAAIVAPAENVRGTVPGVAQQSFALGDCADGAAWIGG